MLQLETATGPCGREADARAGRCDLTPHSPDAVWRHRWGPPAGWRPEAEPQFPARGARDGTKSRRHRGRLWARGSCAAAAHDGRAARSALVRGPRNRVRRGGTRHVCECACAGELCTTRWVFVGAARWRPCGDAPGSDGGLSPQLHGHDAAAAQAARMLRKRLQVAQE
jgi:hypothetical protein